MNSKRKIKRMFSAMDDIALPSAEKMLPPEALVERSNTVRRARKAFPKFAAAGFAAVALVLAGALIVGSVAAGSGNKQAPDGDVVLKNEISAPSYDDTTVDESKVALEDMPIISCGKYTGSLSNDFSVSYEPGKVYFQLMKGLVPVDMDEYLTRDDALYAVYFKVDVGDCRVYAKEEIEIIKQELQQKKNDYTEKMLSGIFSKYGIEAFSGAVNGFLCVCGIKEKISVESIAGSLVSALKDNMNCSEFVAKIAGYDSHDSFYDYDSFCDMFVDYFACFEYSVRECIKSDDTRLEYEEWRKTLWAELRTAFDEYEEKLLSLKRSLRETAETSMNEYLGSLNIQFYEKNVYCKSSLDGEISPFTLESSDGVYSIAFLTREQIKSLEAGEDYALIIRLACEELATMDNEPAVVSDSFYWLND